VLVVSEDLLQIVASADLELLTAELTAVAEHSC
jgi:hypothetical protein